MDPHFRLCNGWSVRHDFILSMFICHVGGCKLSHKAAVNTHLTFSGWLAADIRRAVKKQKQEEPENSQSWIGLQWVNQVENGVYTKV